MIDWQQAWVLIQETLNAWSADAIAMLPHVLVAILVVAVFWLIASVGKSITRSAMKKSRLSDTLTTLLATIAWILIFGLGLVIALNVLQLQKTVVSLLAGAGVAGIALAFAFQDIAANFMSGVILAFRKPFKIGDLVEAYNIFGNVEGINLRTTNVRKPDGPLVLIPNRHVLENPLVNYSEMGKRRIDIECGISYGDDLKKVRKIAIAAIKKIDGVDKKKDIDLFYKEFGDSSINFVVRFWVEFKNRNKEHLLPQSEAIMAMKEAFDKEGITIPFPIRTLDFGAKGGVELKEMLKKK